MSPCVCLGFLERKIPIGRRPVSLTGIALSGVPQLHSLSGDENMTPPEYPSPPTPPTTSEAMHHTVSASQELNPARKAGKTPSLHSLTSLASPHLALLCGRQVHCKNDNNQKSSSRNPSVLHSGETSKKKSVKPLVDNLVPGGTLKVCL